MAERAGARVQLDPMRQAGTRDPLGLSYACPLTTGRRASDRLREELVERRRQAILAADPFGHELGLQSLAVGKGMLLGFLQVKGSRFASLELEQERANLRRAHVLGGVLLRVPPQRGARRKLNLFGLPGR